MPNSDFAASRIPPFMLVINRHAVGRPAINVDIRDIEYLRSLRFTWTKIAEILGISRSTLYRRLQEEGLSQDATYSDINDVDLDQLIKEIKEVHPNDGERMIIGHLAQHGVILQRARIRASIHRIDPVNTAIRRSVALRRRVYHVDGPNCVWHIDGHHKLIRWRFVTHAGIDGFSRTITYIKCSTNNCADTVLSVFSRATQLYGLPERVRTDLGGENVEVWRYMIEQHRSTSAVITGSSTHNERIERLWRDVHRCITSLFHSLFHRLEDEQLLDCLNEVDMFCLRYSFLERINDALTSFMDSWNNHSLSSELSLTPNQLFIQGALQQNTFPVYPTLSHLPGNLAQPHSRDHVNIPDTKFTPCDTLANVLSGINVLQHCDDLGYNVFVRVIQSVGHHLSQGCTNCNIGN